MKAKNEAKAVQKPDYGIYRKLLIALTAVLVVAPVLFTLVQMGLFAGEPTVDIKPTAGPDAPVLRVAADYDFCPNSYYNSNGELSGLYIEIVTEAANRLGMQVEFKTGAWLDCRAMLAEGDADVLLGLEIFSNMEGTLRTIPLCSDELCVYGKEAVDSAATLAGRRVALMARSVIEASYDLQCEYVEYNTNTEILQAVENGEADYAICHSAVSEKLIEKNHLDLRRGLAIAKSFPAMAVSASRPELRTALNEALQSMSRDETIGRLQQKWIDDFTRSRSLRYVLKTNQVLYDMFILALIVVVSALVIYYVLDRRQARYIRSLLDVQRQLKESNEAALRANRAKTVFLSHMSHDFRTPVNGILGMAERIRRKKDEPETVDDCLDKIKGAAGHLLELMDDVLDMSRLEVGEVRLTRSPFDLNEELRRVRSIAEESAKVKGIALEFRMDGAVHTRLLGSPMHLRRILLNLVSNAVKYNRPGGRVDVSVREVGGDDRRVALRFVVRDTGIGMSEEFVQKSLFHPFTQEHDNARTEYQGTGLGMAIVSDLVKFMGGAIGVESRLGEGTTFTVQLEFDLNPAEPPAATDAQPLTDISGMRVLVAEDNDLNLEIARCMLQDAGVKTAEARNGREAVEKFAASEEGAFDAILMDVMMPVMDGMQAARAIRALPRRDAADVPIIAMTANAFAEDQSRARDCGMTKYLTKPVDPAKLRAALSVCRRQA